MVSKLTPKNDATDTTQEDTPGPGVTPPENTPLPKDNPPDDKPNRELSEDPSEWPDDPSQEQLAKVYGKPQEGWKLNRDGSVTAIGIPTYK